MTASVDAEDARAAALAALLIAAGWERAERTPLAGDASTRRYERLSHEGRTAILMDAPPRAEAGPCPPAATEAERLALGWNASSRLAASRVEAFLAVGAHLHGAGFSAPEVYAADPAAGFALLEDLGDDVFARAIAAGAPEATLYTRAGETLAAVQAAGPPHDTGAWPVLEFDALALRVNVDLFPEWAPRTGEVVMGDAQRVRFEAVRTALIEHALSLPRAFTLRDYHAENLLWLPQRDGAKAVGLLDFQDAVIGFRGWDLTMLLHDARRDVSPAASAAAFQAFVGAADADPAAVKGEIALLGALNILRILGLFARLAERDGKPRYLQFMPRMWGHLAGVLDDPALAELRSLLIEVAPGPLAAAGLEPTR